MKFTLKEFYSESGLISFCFPADFPTVLTGETSANLARALWTGSERLCWARVRAIFARVCE